jgi:hypothetical protein
VAYVKVSKNFIFTSKDKILGREQLKRLIALLILTLMLFSLLSSLSSISMVKAGAVLCVNVVDSVTGEKLNGIDVKATWGSKMERQSTHTIFNYGETIFDLGDINYTGDVLLSACDPIGRYKSKNELVHVAFQQWVNTSATYTLKLDRVTPLRSSYSGKYITMLIKDREILYYQESAYIVLGIYSPFPYVYVVVGVPSGVVVDIYGGGYISMVGVDRTNVTLQLYHRGYSHFEKTGTFNISLYYDGTYLETVPVTFTFKPAWGYDNYKLNVKVINSKTKEALVGIPVHVWWGSTLNRYDYQCTVYQTTDSGVSDCIATFNLGAYPNGKVLLKIDDQFKEIIMDENPKNITIELESGGEKGNSITPTPINLWIIIAVFVILVTGILLGFMLFRKKQMMRMMKR